MTDDDCGCKCRECREQDQHRCGKPQCGYTKYLAMTKPAATVPASEALDPLRAQFRRIKDPASRERLRAWTAFCFETAELEPELREAKRREKWAEVFG